MRRGNSWTQAMLFVILYFGFCSIYVHSFIPSTFKYYRIPAALRGTSLGKTIHSPLMRQLLQRRCRHQLQRMSHLCMVNFGPYGDFLNSKVNDDDEPLSDDASESSNQLDYFFTMSSSSSLDKVDSDAAAGTFRLLEISTDSMKPGGLRLFIVMYLLGQASIPHKQAWKVDRPSSEEYIIDFWFHDQSAILSIELIPPISETDASDNSKSVIHINRIGSSPSKQYLIHEAVVLQGLLNEILLCATDPAVAEQDRLLVLPDEKIKTIHEVCDVLPFG
jgi:hypothetical protein